MDTELAALLDAAGVEVNGTVEVERECAWSTVLRVPTTEGLLWCKRCGGDGGFEPALVAAFDAAGETIGPPVVLADGDWLVTRDAGRQLRGSTASVVDALCDMQAPFVEFQRRWTSRLDELRATGLPVVELADMPGLVQQLALVCDERFAAVNDPLTADEQRQLARANEFMAPHIERLEALGLGVTAQHDDVHAGNILVDDTGATSLIDWGDASVAHPFTHMTVVANSLAYELGTTADDPQVDRVRTAYLEQWTDVAPLEELRAACASAEYLGAVLRAESWRRALAFADEPSMVAYGPSVPAWLRRVLPANSTV